MIISHRGRCAGCKILHFSRCLSRVLSRIYAASLGWCAYSFFSVKCSRRVFNFATLWKDNAITTGGTITIARCWIPERKINKALAIVYVWCGCACVAHNIQRDFISVFELGGCVYGMHLHCCHKVYPAESARAIYGRRDYLFTRVLVNCVCVCVMRTLARHSMATHTENGLRAREKVALPKHSLNARAYCL